MTLSGHYSISRRLLLASIAMLPLFLGMTGYAIDRAHSHSLVTGERDRLRLHFYGMLGALELEADGDINMERLREPHFWQFRSGLYAAITDEAGHTLWLSPSAMTLPLPLYVPRIPRPGEEVFEQVSASEGPGFFRLRYHILWEDDTNRDIPLTFTLLSSMDIYMDEQASFRQQMLLWLSLAALLLVLIQGAVLRWGLSPLRRLAMELADLEQGRREQLTGTYPQELTAITRNLNRLLDKEKKQRERYRNTLADLAHSLKTPLSVLRNLFDSGHGEPNPKVANEQLQRMEGIIGYQLQRAVSSGPPQLGLRRPLQPLLQRLLDTLNKVYTSKIVEVSVDIEPELQTAVDDDDMLELLGNLLDNAYKACRRAITIRARKQADHVVITISDDGPGVSSDIARQLLERGQRGDQYHSGQGLGLAIVADIISAYGGEIFLESAQPSGASITVKLNV